MGCACTDRKKQDYEYIRKLANAASITNKVDVQIYYVIGYDGKTKYYDYEPTNGGRKLQVVETIQFSEHESIAILSDNELAGLDTVIEEKVTEPIAGRKRTYKPRNTRPLD